MDLCNLKNWVFPFFWDWKSSERKFLKNEDHWKPSILVNQITFQVILIKVKWLFGFSLKMKLFLLPVPRWVGDSTDLPSSSNITKMVRVNIAFTGTFSIWYYLILETICLYSKDVIISVVVDLILLLLCTFNKISLYHRCFSNALSVNLQNMNLSRSFWSEVASYFW